MGFLYIIGGNFGFGLVNCRLWWIFVVRLWYVFLFDSDTVVLVIGTYNLMKTSVKILFLASLLVYGNVDFDEEDDSTNSLE